MKYKNTVTMINDLFPDFESAQPHEAADGSHRYRSIWISDIHIGLRACKAEQLLDFLRHNESQYLYLVGDIIDGWQLKKSWYWNQKNNDLIQKLLRKSRKGTHVTFIPGNHDEFARQYVGLNFGGVKVAYEAVHTMADGRKFLVLHGDKFDMIVMRSKWLAVLGSEAYDFTLFLNQIFNFIRTRLGYPYWSLSAYIKDRVKNAVKFVSKYEQAVVQEAKRKKLDGVICGHIHKAEMRKIDDILYCNDGDWVESCTALVEHLDGRLELVSWTEVLKPNEKVTSPVS